MCPQHPIVPYFIFHLCFFPDIALSPSATIRSLCLCAVLTPPEHLLVTPFTNGFLISISALSRNKLFHLRTT